MSDYEIDERSCPSCGHHFTHRRRCSELRCDNGWINVYEEDPLWYEPGDEVACQVCSGTGVEAWCPACGQDLQIQPENGREQFNLPGVW